MSNELNRTLLLKEENIKIKKVPRIPADRVGGDDHTSISWKTLKSG